MDLNKIKERLNQVSEGKKGYSSEKIDYTTLYWKPRKKGTYQIRFVPSKINADDPFQEVMMHYGFTKFPILALTNWGEKDPITEMAKKLYKSEDTEDWELAKKIRPKARYFAPIIVRGEEDKGVRLYEFGANVLKSLLSIAAKPDYGDFTDVVEGFDFDLEATPSENGIGFKHNLIPSRKNSQLSHDATLVEKWLEEQPILLDIRKKYTYDELKEVFQAWVDPENDSDDDDLSSDEKEGEDVDNVPFEKPYKLAKKPSKKDEFDAMFEED